MTAEVENQVIPLMIRHVLRSASNMTPRKGSVGADAEDALPNTVKRRADGTIATRDSSLTEVGQETTDDN